MLRGTAAYLQGYSTNKNSLISPETAKGSHRNRKVQIFFAGSEGVDTTSFGAEKYQGMEYKGSLLRGWGFAGKSQLANLQPEYNH